MYSKKLLLLPILVWVVTANCAGQSRIPVSWSFETERISNHEFIFSAHADVAPGWHLYSLFSDDEGPQPTRIVFEPATAYQREGLPEETGHKLTFYDSLYEMNITWLSEHVSFVQRIKLLQPITHISGQIEYMVCNTHMCIPDKRTFRVGF